MRVTSVVAFYGIPEKHLICALFRGYALKFTVILLQQFYVPSRNGEQSKGTLTVFVNSTLASTDVLLHMTRRRRWGEPSVPLVEENVLRDRPGGCPSASAVLSKGSHTRTWTPLLRSRNSNSKKETNTVTICFFAREGTRRVCFFFVFFVCVVTTYG